MKNLLLSFLAFFVVTCFTSGISSSQTRRVDHEKPVIADFVPNIPEELIEGGKLSKFVALSVPNDEQWNPDNIDLNANDAIFTISQTLYTQRGCYFGGHFDSINGRPLKRIAFFEDRDSGKFSDVGGGIEGGDVYTIIIGQDGEELYVGGNFTKAGNINAHCIGHWTGSEWEALGSGTDSTVLALAIVANTLYVGGNFRTAGGQTANYIAKWDLITKIWQPIIDGSVNGMDGGVATLNMGFNGEIFAGGGFTKAGSVAANKIAMFSAGKWSALGSGIEGKNAFVSVIAENNYSNFVGGDFHQAGGLSVSNIAHWDGANWSGLNEFPWGFDGPVYTIGRPGPLFIGGDFHKSGLTTCNNIVKSNYGSPPFAMGSGLDGPCYALAGKFLALSLQGDFSDHLYVGGKFTQAGLKPSQNFAIWGEEVASVHQKPSLASQVSLRISPSPAQISSSISFTLPNRMYTSLSVIDALGRVVLSLGSGCREAGAQRVPFEVKNLPNGVYYCNLTVQGQSVSTPFVVIR